MDIPSNVWFPVVTLVTGILLKGLFDIFSDRRIARRDSDARREQRLDNIRLRRAEVQREALLELQSFSMKLGRATAQIHFHDITTYRTSGSWRGEFIPEAIDLGALEGQAGMSTWRVRIRDADVRRLAETVSETCTRVALAQDEAASNHALQLALSLNSELQERIGEVLRNLESEEDQIARD